MRKNIIALLTDFGTSDSYVGVMKGVILSISPDARIVDITHHITPQNIDEAAYILWSCYRFFPQGTIFVSIVDPGVGSKRKILCVETDNHVFIAPDNGLLRYVLSSVHTQNVVEVSNRKYFLSEVSSTFHGRDVFTPVAAHLARGLAIHELGAPVIPEFGREWFTVVDPKKRESYPGKVLHIDRFGNLVTSFLLERETELTSTIQIGQFRISGFCSAYSDAASNEPFIVRGSSKLLEISLKNDNAAKFLGANVGQEISMRVESL